MKVLHALERKVGRFAIPNLTIYLVTGQAIAYAIAMVKPEFVTRLMLIPHLVPREPWRLLTFVFVPPDSHVVLILFALYMFWMFGSALEEHWGAFRYNLYILIAYLATVASAMLVPGGEVTNAYIGGSVFLAFAFLHPNFELLLFFLLPVKVKWLALITWLGYGWTLITGDWTSRALVIASIANFLLFFGKELAQRIRYGHRRMQTQATNTRLRAPELGERPRHQCVQCGITDKTHPGMQFRYMPTPEGTRCYCMDHLPVTAKSSRPPPPAPPPES